MSNQFPINLSNSKESVYLCTWNGDEITELHTLASLREQYGDTNLYDDEEFKHFFDTSESFEDYAKSMGHGDYHIFDNMRIECIYSYNEVTV